MCNTIVKQLEEQLELQVNQKELTSDLYKNKPVDRGVDKLSTRLQRKLDFVQTPKPLILYSVVELFPMVYNNMTHINNFLVISNDNVHILYVCD